LAKKEKVRAFHTEYSRNYESWEMVVAVTCAIYSGGIGGCACTWQIFANHRDDSDFWRGAVLVKDHVWIESRGKRLSAMVHQPQGVSNPPVVIVCHGFTGEKVGGNQFNLHVANGIEAAGFAVVRFEYAGSGESEGEFAVDTTITGWKSDLREVVHWVKKQPALQKGPLFLLGHSLGGCVVLLHEDTDHLISGRIALAPVIHPEENFREIILGPQMWAASLAGETISHFFGKGYFLQPNFVRDIARQNHSPLQVGQTYADPVLLIHGTEDPAVPAEGSRQFYQEYNGPKELFLIEGADHSFSRHMAELREKIVEWLRSHV
jgi:alpha-beta hydrolase superfamily lysophospholipase